MQKEATWQVENKLRKCWNKVEKNEKKLKESWKKVEKLKQKLKKKVKKNVEKKLKEKFKQIARGTTDPGYWVWNLNNLFQLI